MPVYNLGPQEVEASGFTEQPGVTQEDNTSRWGGKHPATVLPSLTGPSSEDLENYIVPLSSCSPFVCLVYLTVCWSFCLKKVFLGSIIWRPRMKVPSSREDLFCSC